MKIFFTSSQRGKKQFGKYFYLITQAITKLGYTLVKDDLLTVSSKDFYHNLEKYVREGYVNFYRSKIKSIQKADICIFESSTHSLSIGFLIEKALDLQKPTIVLYLQGHPVYLLQGVQHEKLIIKSYSSDTLSKVVKNAIEKAVSIRDTRFNFFINPELLQYIEEKSRKKRTTKSEIIRRLIIEDIKKQLP